MPKSDKELTAEIICSYIHAWGSQSNCVPVKSSELPNLIKTVYSTIVELEGVDSKK
ncbi:MAG TPA: MucR family transcriptional regulator [Clostridiales bacterium]|nr:MucR family transcriptional regulator [Clostridiales bacterium]